jgi:hypothetical protein
MLIYPKLLTELVRQILFRLITNKIINKYSSIISSATATKISDDRSFMVFKKKFFANFFKTIC